MSSLPIVENNVEGMTLLSTWLVVIREDAEFADRAIAGDVRSKQRALRLALTLNHEAVHFLQGITTAVPFSCSFNLLGLCSQMMARSRAGDLNATSLLEFRSAYAEHNRILTETHAKISPIDLMEAMAVTEGFRATFESPSKKAFADYLNEYFPDANGAYRTVIDLVRQRFDIETALEFTSRLCFLALNSNAPAENFVRYIDYFAENHRTTAKSMTAWEISEHLDLDPRQSLLSLYRTDAMQDAQHPILTPFIEHLLSVSTLEEAFEFAARPGDWMRGTGPSGIENLVPPLVIFSGGQGRIMGLARQWDQQQTFQFIDAASLVGACQRLLSHEDVYRPCPFDECFVHASGLCHAWYAIPHKAGWESCAFPKRVQAQFDLSVDDLNRIRSEARGE